MANPINLTVDQQNQVLVAFTNLLGVSVASWPDLFQGSTVDAQIVVANPSGGLSNQYIAQNLAGSTIKVTGCAGQPNGNGTQTILFGPTIFNPSTITTTVAGVASAYTAFTGTLNLTAAAIGTAIGPSPSVACEVEIEIVTAGNSLPIWQGSVTIFAPVDANAVVTPTPSVNYQTAQEAAATFVPQNGGAAGQGRTEISPNGTKYFIYRNNDGTENVQRLA